MAGAPVANLREQTGVTGQISAEVEQIVPFHDVDMMRLAWHGHYLKYFELARCALLDRIGYNYAQMLASGYAWPVIDVHVRYPGRAEYGQRLKVRATLVEWENRLRIEYLITDAESGQRLTLGHTIQHAVNISSGEMQLESPPALLDRVAAAR
jgi:acyl-CoA thioester hydrolase